MVGVMLAPNASAAGSEIGRLAQEIQRRPVCL